MKIKEKNRLRTKRKRAKQNDKIKKNIRKYEFSLSTNLIERLFAKYEFD